MTEQCRYIQFLSLWQANDKSSIHPDRKERHQDTLQTCFVSDKEGAGQEFEVRGTGTTALNKLALWPWASPWSSVTHPWTWDKLEDSGLSTAICFFSCTYYSPVAPSQEPWSVAGHGGRLPWPQLTCMKCVEGSGFWNRMLVRWLACVLRWLTGKSWCVCEQAEVRTH